MRKAGKDFPFNLLQPELQQTVARQSIDSDDENKWIPHFLDIYYKKT